MLGQLGLLCCCDCYSKLADLQPQPRRLHMLACLERKCRPALTKAACQGAGPQQACHSFCRLWWKRVAGSTPRPQSQSTSQVRKCSRRREEKEKGKKERKRPADFLEGNLCQPGKHGTTRRPSSRSRPLCWAAALLQEPIWPPAHRSGTAAVAHLRWSPLGRPSVYLCSSAA